MNSETGEIYRFETDKQKAAKEAELEQVNQKLIELTDEQAKFLGQFHEHERPRLHRDLLSKNHSAKRRAKRKIEKASRRRNRK